MALRRYVRAAALLVAPAFLLASCSSGAALDHNGIPTGPISGSSIAAQPLSHLYYPGSTPFYMLQSGSSEAQGSAPAYAGAILATSATGAQVYSWYLAKLRSLGWTFVTDKGCVDIQPSCPQFGHDGHGTRETFYLAIDNPALLPSVIGRSAPEACTIFEMSYEIFPPGGIRIPSPIRFDGGHQCWWTGGGWHKPSDVP